MKYLFTSGKPVIAIFQGNDQSASLSVDAIKLVDSAGTVFKKIDDVLFLDDSTFVTYFIPPDKQFHWQIEGKDENGNHFSRITDTAIEVSDIDLTLGNDTSIVIALYIFW